jgi:NAD(P) transhydrogenase subunit beta
MNPAMAQGVVTAASLAAAVLFILSLGGLSNPETSRRGNVFGMVGMTIAVGATILGLAYTTFSSGAGALGPFGWLTGALLAGTVVGATLAARVKMTQMPELVAILHSFVGLAAVLVGYANFLDPGSHLAGAERTIHLVETYLGILIGAVTFSGSVVAFGSSAAVSAASRCCCPRATGSTSAC